MWWHRPPTVGRAALPPAASDFNDKIVLAGSGRSREEDKETSTWTKGWSSGCVQANNWWVQRGRRVAAPTATTHGQPRPTTASHRSTVHRATPDHAAATQAAAATNTWASTVSEPGHTKEVVVSAVAHTAFRAARRQWLLQNGGMVRQHDARPWH